MTIIKRYLETVLRNGPTVLAFGICIGIIIPPLAEISKDWIAETVFIFVLGTLLRTNITEVFAAVKKPSVSIYFPAFMVIICPYVAGTTSLFLGGSPEMSLAIALAVAAPPASGNAAVARMLGLSPSISLVTTIASMLLVPFTAPLILNTFDPISSITLDPLSLAYRLLSLLGGCVILATSLRMFAPTLIQENNLPIDGAVIFSLLIFACGTMSGMQHKIINDPEIVFTTILLAYLSNIALHISGFIAYPGDLKSRLTMSFTCGNRNIGLLWAVLGTSISPPIALFFACSQLPIYTTPKLLQLIISKTKITIR